jgi:hypothetical protein
MPATASMRLLPAYDRWRSESPFQAFWNYTEFKVALLPFKRPILRHIDYCFAILWYPDFAGANDPAYLPRLADFIAESAYFHRRYDRFPEGK